MNGHWICSVVYIYICIKQKKLQNPPFPFPRRLAAGKPPVAIPARSANPTSRRAEVPRRQRERALAPGGAEQELRHRESHFRGASRTRRAGGKLVEGLGTACGGPVAVPGVLFLFDFWSEGLKRKVPPSGARFCGFGGLLLSLLAGRKRRKVWQRV